MSERNIQTEDWPKINSLILINAGTRISCDVLDRSIVIVPSYDDEVVGVVLSHDPGFDWRFDAIEVMVEDSVFRIIRTPGHSNLSYPYFNVRQLNDDGTTKQF